MIFLFLFFCCLAAFLDSGDRHSKIPELDNSSYNNGIINDDTSSYIRTADYFLNVKLNIDKKNIHVNEKIIWRNLTEYSTNELWIHLYANGYKSNNSLFASEYPVNEKTRTELQLLSVKVNTEETMPEYISENHEYPNDSTRARITLENEIQAGDSVIIEFEYRLNIPESMKRLGYATGRDFYFISQWYPKLGVFKNGEWICSQFHPHTNFYSEFSDYYVTITTPAEYRLISTGLARETSIENGNMKSVIHQKGIHDFVWIATNEINEYRQIITRPDSSQFILQLFLQSENTEYADRYFDVLKFSIEYFEEHFGSYPYSTLTCVDVPRTSKAGAMEYPTLFTVYTELFAREATLRLEALAMHEFIHQYFQGIVANNEVHEAWLDEGITTYLTTKALSEKYGTPYVTFKFLDYLSIEGINFLSYNEIPLIYTLGDYKQPEGFDSYSYYYRNNNIGAIADSSNSHPDKQAYYVNAYHKPELMILSLEKIIGEEKMLSILSEYFMLYRFRHPGSAEFIELVKKSVDTNLDVFFENCFYKNVLFDYAVTDVRLVKDNKYEVIVQRKGDGIFVNDLAFYTSSDTTIIKWDGIDRWKRFVFYSDSEVFGAEIDPFGKNRFDINFANNSYTISKQSWGSLSFSLRWFFWIQNALLILGSVA